MKLVVALCVLILALASPIQSQESSLGEAERVQDGQAYGQRHDRPQEPAIRDRLESTAETTSDSRFADFWLVLSGLLIITSPFLILIVLFLVVWGPRKFEDEWKRASWPPRFARHRKDDRRRFVPGKYETVDRRPHETDERRR